MGNGNRIALREALIKAIRALPTDSGRRKWAKILSKQLWDLNKDIKN